MPKGLKSRRLGYDAPSWDKMVTNPPHKPGTSEMTENLPLTPGTAQSVRHLAAQVARKRRKPRTLT